MVAVAFCECSPTESEKNRRKRPLRRRVRAPLHAFRYRFRVARGEENDAARADETKLIASVGKAAEKRKLRPVPSTTRRTPVAALPPFARSAVKRKRTAARRRRQTSGQLG